MGQPVAGDAAEEPRLSLSVHRPEETDGLAEIRCSGIQGGLCRLLESRDLISWQPRATASVSEGEASFLVPTRDTGSAFYQVEALQMRPLEEMVWVEPGEFMISSPPDEEGRFLDKEDPETRVVITRGFWISRYEVTQAAFEAVLNFNPSLFKGEMLRPVEDVTWFDAVRYCDRLTERERDAGNLPPNFAYRLPTEAEWAYAARAGTTTRFSYGDDPGYEQLRNYAWYAGNSGLRPHPVGQKLPNPWGLYDMHGNVFEWCADWFGNLPGGVVTDPQGPESGIDRVIRGGYWDSSPAFCRSALRVHYPPATRISYLGFRVAMSEVGPDAPE